MPAPSITVVTPEEAEQCDLVVCMRVSEARLIAPGSTQQACHDCGHPIWVAPTSPAAPIKVCVHCAEQRMRGGRA